MATRLKPSPLLPWPNWSDRLQNLPVTGVLPCYRQVPASTGKLMASALYPGYFIVTLHG